MAEFRLHKNVAVELPRSLKKNISITTLEKARQICQNLNLPKIKVEVMNNLQKHPLCPLGAHFGFYITPNAIPPDYPIQSGAALIGILEDDNEFLVTLFHEFGHAVEPKRGLEENCAELWAYLWAFLILQETRCRKEAKECWNMALKYKKELDKKMAET